MAATVYLDRDNAITLELKQDGSYVTENSVILAALWIPASAFNDANPRTLDTEGESMELIENGTKVKLDLGSSNLIPGIHRCYLTVYDAVNINGIAWDTLTIRVRDWPV